MDFVNNPKYEQVMKTALKLFMRHGIRRITIEEICKEAGVSKMTFYKFFKNKNKLAIQVLESLFEENIGIYNDLMKQDISYPDKIKELIRFKVEKSKEYGQSFLIDILEAVPELHDYIMQKRTESIHLSLQLLEEGKKAGYIDENMKPEFFLYLLNQIQVIFDSDEIKAIFPDITERTEHLVTFMFYGLLNKSKL
ncbi:MAG: TetR/AcrR family transcriptional regulator [bacterium]|nr:TetR/AcrR family transcriptional regulator [bacterium]